jgi:hypothetical protein
MVTFVHLFVRLDVNIFYKFSEKPKLDMINLIQNNISLVLNYKSSCGFSRYMTRYTQRRVNTYIYITTIIMLINRIYVHIQYTIVSSYNN